MISGGDELGRSQLGNNNAYCQDSPLTWTPWTSDDGADLALLEFVRTLAAWRRDTPAVRRAEFLTTRDVAWLRLDGSPIEPDAWHAPDLDGFIMRLSGPTPVDIVVDDRSVTMRAPVG
jgi:glycogen operon protein